MTENKQVTVTGQAKSSVGSKVRVSITRDERQRIKRILRSATPFTEVQRATVLNDVNSQFAGCTGDVLQNDGNVIAMRFNDGGFTYWFPVCLVEVSK